MQNNNDNKGVNDINESSFDNEGMKEKLEIGKERGRRSKVGQWEKRKMNISEESSSSQIPNYRKTEKL